MSKSTPGPWDWDVLTTCFSVLSRDIEKPIARLDFYVFVGNSPKEIRESQFDRPRDEQEANARLIAAAPELLEAAKRALRYLDTKANHEADEHILHAFLSTRIAKAEGR